MSGPHDTLDHPERSRQLSPSTHPTTQACDPLSHALFHPNLFGGALTGYPLVRLPHPRSYTSLYLLIRQHRDTHYSYNPLHLLILGCANLFSGARHTRHRRSVGLTWRVAREDTARLLSTPSYLDEVPEIQNLKAFSSGALCQSSIEGSWGVL